MFARTWIICLFTAVVIAPKAQAQWLFSPTLTYESTTDKPDGGTESKRTFIPIHARVGYIMTSQVYVGGVYEQESWDYGDSNKTTLTAYGPSIGYVSTKGFNIIAHYLLGGENKLSDTVSRTGGSGPQVDIGYAFELNSTFALGPQLMYRSLSYSKVKSGAIESESKHTTTEIRPMVALFVTL